MKKTDPQNLRETQILSILDEFKRVWLEFDQFPFGKLVTLLIRDGKRQFNMSDEEFLKILKDPNLIIQAPKTP